MNVWFLRMDKDGWNDFDLCESYKFIHSAHGSCGDLGVALKHKNAVFPELTMSGKELVKLIRSIKEELVSDGLIDLKKSGKRRCDVAIRYWLSIMKVGDLIFVRNKQDKVMLSKVTGYISEEFFESHGCFQRPVEIINEITESMVPPEIWRRTQGRKTIEINAKKHITDWVACNYK
ncbi:MAG: hypothetical protein ACJAWL_001804 [Motiliproteus sp.]|jgi:hypothetical protein